MELVLVGIAFIICSILLLISISKKNRRGGDNSLGKTHKKSGVSRFIERIEELKFNSRNYFEPEQLSSNQKLSLELTYRKIKRVIAYILIAIGFVFLIC